MKNSGKFIAPSGNLQWTPCLYNNDDDKFNVVVTKSRRVPLAERVKALSAKSICLTCPQEIECLEYALDHEIKGIRGGTDDIERSTMFNLRRNYS
jgi:hypothetical protein